MPEILIICEHEDGVIKDHSFELASKAFELASARGQKVDAVLFGDAAAEQARMLGCCGVSTVHVVTGDTVNDHDPAVLSDVLLKIINRNVPDLVFASSSYLGNDLLPRVAARLDSGMLSDCIDIDLNGSSLIFKRSVYGGKLIASMTIDSSTKFATFRQNIFPIKRSVTHDADVRSIKALPIASSMKLIQRLIESQEELDITGANVVVAGGRALAGRENFGILLDLAWELNAAVGASRAAVDAGYISLEHQIGQTGKTVNPKLYIACGISGAIQHLSGMRSSKIIVAINSDPEAPIFLRADLGIVGDIFKIVPAVIKILRAGTVKS